MTSRHLLALLASVAVITACGERAAEQPAAEEPSAGVGMELPASTTSEEALAHYQAGWDAFDMFRFNAAHDHFQKATEADSEFAMAHLMSAFSSPSTEKFASELATAGELAPNATEGEQLVIKAFQKGFDGDQRGQVATLIEASEVNPGSAHVLQLLAFSQGNQNDVDGQRATLREALKLDTAKAATHMALGNSFLLQEPKAFDKAEEHFRKATELAPDEPNPHDLLGDVHRAMGKFEAAYDDYTKAAELAPDMGLPVQQRGHVNSFLGNYEAARADYTRSAELEDARGTNVGPGFLMYRTFVNLHEGNPDAAIAELAELCNDVQASGIEGAADLCIGAMTNAAQVATHYGNSEKAGEVIGEAAAFMRAQADEVGTEQFRSAQEANIAYLEGLLAARTGDVEGAATKAAEFEEHVAATTSPRKLERMHEILGMSAYHQGDYAGAIEHLKQGDLLTDTYTKYHLALAHEAVGDDDQANTMLTELAAWNFNSAAFAMTRKDILAKVSAD